MSSNSAGRRSQSSSTNWPMPARAILRAHLERWAMEVGIFCAGVTATSSAEELARIAPQHPASNRARPR
ncbi:MAG TPA: hypothetical protein VED84_06325 [Acidimicrobiales bacterium]|nr:hypothetical protein [Acidimicrobiales bacterium]